MDVELKILGSNKQDAVLCCALPSVSSFTAPRHNALFSELLIPDASQTIPCTFSSN